MARSLAVAALCAAVSAAGAANTWNHGWVTAGDSSFADFNSNTLLTDAQAADVASKVSSLPAGLL